MSSEILSAKDMLAARRASRRVFKRPKLTNSQRAAYYGYSEFIKNESDSDETTTADEKMQVHESSNRSSQFETSKAFIISSNSALGILDKTKNAANTRDDEQEVLDRTTSYGPSETSKASISFSESVLNAFDKPRLRDATFYDDNENASKIFDDEIEENSTHVSNESHEIFEKSTVEYMEEENEYATKISFDRKGTPKITPAYPEETPEKKSPYLKKLAEAAAPVAKEPITTLSQPVKTRAALLLPRFMQQTNASSSRTNRPPVMCSSPVRGKKFVPLPSPKLRAPLTPRKSVAVLRKVADQSFNAAKLPVLDMALFEDIPKKIITDCNAFCNENSRRAITINDISTVESDNNDDGNFSGFVFPSDVDDDESGEILEQQNDSFDEIEQLSIKDHGDSIDPNNAPGPSHVLPIIHSEPLIPLNVNDTRDDNSTTDQTLNDSIPSNKAPIHINAPLKKNNKNTFILDKPKLIKPELPSSDQPFVRRSSRTRVCPLRAYLGERPMYKLDENGLQVLVGVTEVEIKDSRPNRRNKKVKKRNKRKN